MKFGNLVEICLWLDLAVKGLKEGINDTVDTKGGTLKVNVHVRRIIIINIINISYYNYYHYEGYFPPSAIGVIRLPLWNVSNVLCDLLHNFRVLK